MRKFLLATGLALTAASGVTLAGSGLADATGSPCAQQARHGKLDVVGLTDDQRLVCFKEHEPGEARPIGTVSGLQTDTSLVGIDVRPATGELYGLGNAGGVYTLSTRDASATLKSRLNVALNGTSFGVDFNPTVDRLRIISDTGQNLRANVDDGTTTTDLLLNNAGVTAVGVVGAAYTNNDADPNTATTLFDVDSALDQLSIQAPPNNGSLNPTGKLGVDTSAKVGADIYSKVAKGTTVRNTAFAALEVGGRSTFFSVDVLTGRVSPRGWFAPGTSIIGIALPTV